MRERSLVSLASGLLFLLLQGLVLLQAVPARAEGEWREFRSDTDSFSVSLPATPTISARRIGKSEATQTTFLIETPQTAYLVSVVEVPKGSGPKKPDAAYYQNLMKDYATGSKTTVRSTRMTTLAGRPAFQAVTDAAEATHLVDLVAAGDRVFMVVYVGPKGQETRAEAVRLRDSFKILN
jgi:hypothetical protein